jgi:hydrogenase/urease accessory protein HupE
MAKTSMQRLAAVCAIAAALVPVVPVVAHEMGTTRVSMVVIDHDHYAIEVVTDAATLLEKLESVSDTAGPTPTRDPAELRRRLERLESTFLRRVTIALDGTPAPPVVSWRVSDPSSPGAAPTVTVRLTGNLRDDVRQLTWAYSWTFTSYAFSARRGPSDAGTTEWLEGGQRSAPVPLHTAAAPDSRLKLAGRYIALGFSHILPKGTDHVLFVLGIFLLTRRARPILMQVTAFTAAHSISLALSMYGLVTLPSSIVEPAIALSIAYIAIENVVVVDLKPWRYALVFVFGLLHGLGFAGVLKEIGLPRAQYLTALLGFNAGVELGQLTVIGVAFLTVGYWFRDRVWYRSRIVLPASACIALLGIYWTLERLRVV